MPLHASLRFGTGSTLGSGVTLELLQRRRYPGRQSIVDSLRKNALKVTRKIYPDQIAHMDPILRNHLRVGPTKRRITWLG